MTVKYIKILFWLFSPLTILAKVPEGKDFFVNVNTTRVRALAMGGAFVSVVDGPTSALYNPATVELYRLTKSHRFTVYLNPVGATVLTLDRDDLVNNKLTPLDALTTVGILIKSIALTLGPMETLMVFCDESFTMTRERASPHFFDLKNILDYHSNVGIIRLKLAEQLSLGVSGTFYTFIDGGKKLRKFGLSYGVLLKPDKKFNVGLSYVDLPNKLPGARHELERIEDESLNIGISYRLSKNTLLSADINNVSNDNKRNTRELHLGAEHLPVPHLALRLGYFRDHTTREHFGSIGVGILNMNKIRRAEDELNFPDFVVNYSFIYKRVTTKLDDRWHLLSLLIRI